MGLPVLSAGRCRTARCTRKRKRHEMGRSNRTNMVEWRVRFANRMSDLRDAQGWSQTRLASELGVSRGTVSDIEAARNTASRTTIQKLLDLEQRLGV